MYLGTRAADAPPGHRTACASAPLSWQHRTHVSTRMAAHAWQHQLHLRADAAEAPPRSFAAKCSQDRTLLAQAARSAQRSRRPVVECSALRARPSPAPLLCTSSAPLLCTAA
eukprot:2695586-Rhodomonas_salina.1